MNVIYNVFLGMIVMLKNFDPAFQNEIPLILASQENTTLNHQPTIINIDNYA